MNTYRVYALNTTNATQPTVHVLYIQADKYGPAWQGARAALNGKDKAPTLFDDPQATTKSKIGHGDHLTVAKIDDIRPRNVKLDKAKLQEIINDPKASADDKLAALKATLA